jgi:predicted dehydrogenase
MEDTVLLLCKTATGKLMRIRLDMLSNRPHNLAYYSLQGTKGCYEAPRGFGDAPKIWLADHSSDANTWRSLSEFEAEFMPEIWRNPPPEAREAGHGGGDYFEVREFVDAILQDRKPPVDLYDALDMTVPGLVSEESIRRGGQPLPVPDFRRIERFPEELPAELRESAILRVEL